MVGSAFKARHVAVDNVMDDVNIMDSLREDCAAAAFSDFAFPQARLANDFHIVVKIVLKLKYNLTTPSQQNVLQEILRVHDHQSNPA